MKVSGFTICRNPLKLEYPLLEVIQSALPIVDEFIVNVGPSTDGTVERLESIGSPKIRLVHSAWDESVKKDGLLFSRETNMALEQCSGDWAFYLQADEVIHEEDYDRILQGMRDHHHNQQILGFVFKYLHFYGDYWSTNPWGFHRAVRIIRNNGQLRSSGDAVGFSLKSDGGFLQSKHKDRVSHSGATIYHYSYVKSGFAMQEKTKKIEMLFHGDQPRPEMERQLKQDTYEYVDYSIMKDFRGRHPAVMSHRIAQATRLSARPNRWLNPRFYQAILKRGFRG